MKAYVQIIISTNQNQIYIGNCIANKHKDITNTKTQIQRHNNNCIGNKHKDNNIIVEFKQ